MVPGQVSWLSGHRFLLCLPFPHFQKSGWLSCLREDRSPITVAGPQPILTAFPFPPFIRGTTGTEVFKEQLRKSKLTPHSTRCQATPAQDSGTVRISGRGSVWLVSSMGVYQAQSGEVPIEHSFRVACDPGLNIKDDTQITCRRYSCLRFSGGEAWSNRGGRKHVCAVGGSSLNALYFLGVR